MKTRRNSSGKSLNAVAGKSGSVGSSSHARKAASHSTSSRAAQIQKKAVGSAISFYKRAMRNADVHAIMEELSKL